MFIFYLWAAVLVGILILVHEVGHFLAARAAGVTVERFSIGFGPKILTVKRGETEYALSVIPLGGYVKMAGTEFPEEGEPAEPEPRTFLSKPIRTRALIVAAGPATNFVWAVIVAIGVVLAVGLPTLGEPTIGSVESGSPAEAAGLRPGDTIVSVDGNEVSDWADVIELTGSADEEAIELTVRRDESGETVSVVVEIAQGAETGTSDLGITAYVPPVIGDVMAGGPADRAGIRTGDAIVSVDGVEIDSWYELGNGIRDRAGEELQIVWERQGVLMEAIVVPEEAEEPVGVTGVRRVGMIGVMRPWSMRRLPVHQAFITGFRATISNLNMIVLFFWNLVRGQVSADTIGGPIRIVQIASESARWGASYFLGFMAFFSLNLFLINLLPLPILDGGHLLLLGLEKVRRRSLTERQLLVWQQAGLVFFVGLTIFLLVKDALTTR